MLGPLSRRLLLHFLLVLFLLTANSGCMQGLTWLPDSSGFVYTSGEDAERLILYDLQQKKARFIVFHTGTATVWPAVSPDGEQIAVARLEFKGNRSGSLQVIFYGLSGKPLRRSAILDWPVSDADRKQAQNEGTALFWAPAGDKLLVTNNAQSGIYDAKNDRLAILQSKMPLVFGNSPIRPDGEGFLVMNGSKPGDPAPEVSFVNWKGTEHAIRMDINTPDTRDKQDLLDFSYLVGRWNGAVATIETSSFSLRIDSNKRSGSFQRMKPSAATAEGKLICRREYVFPQSPVGIRVSYLESAKKTLNKEGYCEVETFSKTNRQQSRVVLRAALALLFPAPNGKLVAVLALPEEQGDATIHVLNDKGETVSKIVLEDGLFSNRKKAQVRGKS